MHFDRAIESGWDSCASAGEKLDLTTRQSQRFAVTSRADWQREDRH
jgi:hypothetical protein